MGIDGDVHFWPVHQGLVEIFSVRSFGRSTTYSAEGTRARGEKQKKKGVLHRKIYGEKFLNTLSTSLPKFVRIEKKLFIYRKNDFCDFWFRYTCVRKNIRNFETLLKI